jgi:hypothetical protein
MKFYLKAGIIGSNGKIRLKWKNYGCLFRDFLLYYRTNLRRLSMTRMSIGDMSRTGICWGAGIALVPATVTFIIASSRALLINIIAEGIIRILTAGRFGVTVHGLSMIEVPLLWKISWISFKVGTSIVALSLAALLLNRLYLRAFANG